MLRRVRTVVTPHHCPAPPPPMITPGNTKSALLSPEISQQPALICAYPPPAESRTSWHLFSFEPIGHEPNCKSLPDHPDHRYRPVGSIRESLAMYPDLERIDWDRSFDQAALLRHRVHSPWSYCLRKGTCHGSRSHSPWQHTWSDTTNANSVAVSRAAFRRYHAETCVTTQPWSAFERTADTRLTRAWFFGTAHALDHVARHCVLTGSGPAECGEQGDGFG
jgi:hypothetical protein